MAQTIFGERRTRSQLTLPDELLLHLPQRSPLKDARLARRLLIQEASSSPPNTSEAHEQQSMSSSPPPQGVMDESRSRPKRSMSPAPDASTLERHSEPPPERETKRAKKESDAGESHEPTHRRKNTRHTRLASDPSVIRIRRSTRKRPAEQMKPISSTDSTILSSSDWPKMNQRAQSVPLFPSSSSLPFIDFKNPPPSPRRARSRSPGKEEPKLKIDIPPTKLNNAMEEVMEEMEVEEDEPIRAMQETRPAGQPATIPQHYAQSGPAKPTQPVIAKLTTLQINTNEQVPNTPTCSRPLSSPISPLTPLSETPFPAELEKAGDHMGSSLLERFQSANSRKSQIDSPSDQLKRKSPATLGESIEPFSLYPTSSTSSSVQKASGPGSKPLTVLGRKSSSSSDSNAFSILMQASQTKAKPLLKSGRDKGKQRADLRSSAVSSTTNPFEMDDKKWKDESSDFSSPKSKLKARMRPRERPKVEAVPNLTVPEEAEDDEMVPEQTDSDRWSVPLMPIELSFVPAEPPTPQVPVDPTVDNGAEPSSSSSKDDSRAATDQEIAPSSVDQTSHFAPEQLTIKPATEVHSDIYAPVVSGPEECFEVTIREVEPIETTCDQFGPIRDNPSTQQGEDLELEPPINPVAPPTETATKNNKSRLPRRKPAASIAPVGRLTRSTSSKMKPGEPTPSSSAVQSGPPASSRATRPRPTSTAPLANKPDRAKTPTSTQDEARSLIGTPVPPRTPNRPSTPGRKSVGSSYAKPTTSSAAKVTKTPSKFPKSPSPAKLSHASSSSTRLFNGSSRQSTMITGDKWNSGAPSSLSNLSMALEKLRKPPPSRPNTSLGLNRASDDSNIPAGATKDPSDLGKGHPSSGVKLRRRSRSFDIPSSSGATFKSQPPVQQPISDFFGPKQGSASTNTDGSSTLGTKPAVRRKMFGITSGGALAMGMRTKAPKVSRKTCLPTVAGSPVKGGEPVNDINDDEPIVVDDADNDAKDHSLEIVMDSAPDTASLGADEYLVPIGGDSPKETGKTEEGSGIWQNTSRRASLASLALSESLSALPPKGSMGPPSAIPRHGRVTRSTSNSYISTSQTNSPTDEKGRMMTDTVSKAQTKGSPSTSLGFMKDCVVFVDVRTDDGDDAGSLFVEMLESAGAKVLGRVGQTCTHIVFKNGLLSTMSRYRSLRDPKPFVVGIAWIVECVEHRKHVDETNFLVDLDEMNSIGATKRRKSMFPKLTSLEFGDTNAHNGDHGHEEEDGDQSMDGSNSSMTLDDLPPLEKARRRKSFLVGPRP